MGDPIKRFPGFVDLVKSWIPWKNESANDLRAFWMPDDSCVVCYDCDLQFTIFNRRHHCRKCGRVFCARCTSNFIPAKSCDSKNNLDEVEWIRVCNYCLKLKGENIAVDSDEVQSSNQVLSPQSTTSAASIKSNCTENGNINASVSLSVSHGAHQCLPCVFGSPTDQHVEFESFLENQENIKAETNMTSTKNDGEGYPDHFRFCFNRSDDEDDDYGQCNSDPETQRLLKSGEPFGQYAEDNKISEPDDLHTAEGISDAKSTGDREHDDIEHHEALGVDKMEEHSLDNRDQCNDSSSMYVRDGAELKDVDLENIKQFWLPPEPENEEDDRESLVLDDDEEDATGEWHDLHLSSSFGSHEVKSKDRLTEEHKKAMRSIVDGHFRALVAQLLQAENVDIDETDNEIWLDIITSLSWEVASLLKPDTSHEGEMDPGLYVKVKCLACGHPCDSMLVKGVVCKKNVAHRRMTTKIEKPRLLLLGGALEYQRVSNLLSSFDTLLQQEMDHLKMAVAKIDAHHPNILLVEKSVSRYAQDYLLAKNISLVLNIKKPLLERIARCTGAQIVPSIDHLLSPKLGQCDLFHVEKFLEEHGSAGQGGKKLLKTLMFLEGCPKPLGYTILLKGANGDELKKIKHVLQYGVFAAYNLALETSFLADEGASLPELPLKSPITIALPDKPSSINRSITIIPGLGTHSVEKQKMNDSLRRSFGPDEKLRSGDFHKTGNIGLRHPSGSTSLSVSTLYEPSPVRKVFPVEDDNILSHIESLQGAAPSVSLPQFGNSGSPCHTSKEKLEFAENWSMTQGTDDQTGEHESVKPSTHIGSPEDGVIAENAQNDKHKIEEEQHHYSGLDISNRDNDIYHHSLLREEFPPSPSDHQSILVSLSSRCVVKGTVCERAHLFRIKYYGKSDKPLGRYLRDHLFDQSYRCHSCEMPSAAHIYCYTHPQGSLTISVKNLDGSSLPGERDGKIWMWHRCLRCPPIKGLPPATRRIVMSDAAWGLSFGKFLELSFSNHAAASRVASCGHSLHRDCLRFYGCGYMVACFRYVPINVNSVFLPPSKLDFSYQHQDWVEEANKVAKSAENLFKEVLNLLHQIAEVKQRSSSLDVDEKLTMSIVQLEGMLHEEKADFQESLQKIMRKDENKGKPLIDILEINKLRRQLLFCSYIWDKCLYFAKQSHYDPGELRNYVTNQKKENKYLNSQRSITNFDQVSARGNESSLSELSAETQEGVDHDKHPEASQQREDSQHDNVNIIQNKDQLYYCSNAKQKESSDSSGSVPRALSDGLLGNMLDLSDTLDAKWRGEIGSELADATKSSSLSLLETGFVRSACEGSLEHEGVGPTRSSSSASNAKPGERAEDWIKKSADIYHSYDQSPSLARFDISSEDSFDHVLFTKVQNQCQGRLLLPLGMNNIVIPVYDDEPTSIISYALVCPNYHSQLSDEAEGHRDGCESSISLPTKELQKVELSQASDSVPLESSKSFASLDGSILSMSSSKNHFALDPLASTKPMHARVPFADDGKVKYNVTCYYAKCFDALRRICCPSEIDFIRSLSRCKRWGAQGGKSNVFFAKSLDDRFIIKQVTRTELESFIKFAPEYFKYLSESLSTGSPTCLAKILGIYQVTVKNLISGKESKMDLLVMENLLFGRQVTRLYDLKGSCRSRYNADQNGNNKVLLDQNLIEAMPTSPIFVGNKAKRLLERAVWNDTSFLASIDVMDYSLLVGIDEEKHELVLGIIDYMRQYTWDKHLETWVKASGFLGGHKNESPTVISPKQYKKRFRKAMSAYFLVIPDQWSPPPAMAPSDSASQEKLQDASMVEA